MEGGGYFSGGGFGGGYGGYGGGGGGLMQGSGVDGGSGGFDGNQHGGFLNPSGNAAFGSQGTSRSMQNDKTLLPVTIKQLMEAEAVPGQDSKFSVDGQELWLAKVVGSIVEVQVQSTSITYSIDDSTGTMDVKIWISDGDDDPDSLKRRDVLVKGSYVRVFGKLQEYHSNRNLSGFSITPITDFNEVSNHFAQVMLSHVRVTRGLSSSNAAQASSAIKIGTGAPIGISPAVSGSMAHLSPIQQVVLKIYETTRMDDQGLSRDMVCEKLPDYPRKEIYGAIEFLSGEGHLYTTVDEDHFRTTSSM